MTHIDDDGDAHDPSNPDTATLTDEQVFRIAHAVAQFKADATAVLNTIWPAVQAMAERFKAIHQHLQDAGLIDQDGHPVKPVDRPAWQSPYGPPTRRH